MLIAPSPATAWNTQPQQQQKTGPAGPPAGEQPPAAPPAGATDPVGQIPPEGTVPPSGGSVVPPGATVAGTPDAAATAAAAAAVDSGQVDLATLPPAVQAHIRELRRESAAGREARNQTPAQIEAARAQAAEAERKRIGIALGYIQDDNAAPQSVEELTKTFEAERNTYQQQIRTLRTESALDRVLVGTQPFARAAIVGARILDGLDPDAPDFADQVTAKVSAYLDTYPGLRATTPAVPAPPVGTSGTDFSGSAATPGGRSVAEIREQRKAAAASGRS